MVNKKEIAKDTPVCESISSQILILDSYNFRVLDFRLFCVSSVFDNTITRFIIRMVIISMMMMTIPDYYDDDYHNHDDNHDESVVMVVMMVVTTNLLRVCA